MYAADGNSTQTIIDLYADASLKQKSVTTTTYNQIGSSSTTVVDGNGDGVNDRQIAVVVGVDGYRQEFLTYFDINARGRPKIAS